jgi:DNA repair protein RecO (recombination protein O)
MANFTTEGIIIQKINYSETSLIIKALTKDKGLQSFIFQGAKRKGKKGQIISPLSVVNLTYFQRNDSQLAKISQVDLAVIYKDILFNPIKSSILFYINELIQNSIKEEEYNLQLYEFLKNILQILDLQSELSNFPLKFTLALLGQIGYYPSIDSNGTYFDFLNGRVIKNEPNHPYYLDENTTKYLIDIDNLPMSVNGAIIPSQVKKELLNGLLDYYKIKIEGFKPLKSIEIIEAVLD